MSIFADFGKGCFGLTAFDESYVYVHTFLVTREGTQSGPLVVTRRMLNRYRFRFDHFAEEGKKITGLQMSRPSHVQMKRCSPSSDISRRIMMIMILTIGFMTENLILKITSVVPVFNQEKNKEKRSMGI